jgi:glutaredoxin
MMTRVSSKFSQSTPVRKLAGLCVLSLACACASAQTVYRIVGPDGKVTFSDKPPVAGAANVTATGRDGKAVDVAGNALPFELRQVAQRFPVTFYTSTNCAPCGSGRSMLASRGIPYTERTVTTSEDNDALLRLSGENSLPFLTIGGQKIRGFSESEWTQFLDAAGYPASSVLPANFRNPPPSPLVAVQKPEVPKPVAATPRQEPPVPAPAANNDTASNPAGIRF